MVETVVPIFGKNTPWHKFCYYYRGAKKEFPNWENKTSRVAKITAQVVHKRL